MTDILVPMPQQLLLISDERMISHNAGHGHPERPERLRSILDVLHPRVFARPSPAPRSAIERIHQPSYVDQIESVRGQSGQLDADTAVSPESVQAAYLAAGAALQAVEALMRGDARRAFALIRPPGHHAEAMQAMGFCLFNNIAIAAVHAIANLGCKRILIIDWDVHHGNGTQHAFESRRDVLVFDVHQHRLFPDSGNLQEVGAGPGRGYTINAPLPAGMDDAAYLELFRQVLLPVADAFQPELVLVSAGFDAHRDDPLGGMEVTDAGFAAMCAIARDIADRHACGRLALILEGGYNLQALTASIHACIEILNGGQPPTIGPASGRARALIDEIRTFHATHWPQLRSFTS